MTAVGDLPMQTPKMDESSQARQNRAYLDEIEKYSYFVDPLGSNNLEGRDAYLECARKYMKIKSQLPKDVISSSFSAFVVRTGPGAGIYETLYNVPNTLTASEYEGMIAFPNACEAESWWNDVPRHQMVKRSRKKPMRQRPKYESAYSKKCEEALEGFDQKVMDFSSGDTDKDTRGK